MEDVHEAGTSHGAQQGPPASIEFALDCKRLVRYNRMARNGDADAAVLGKGGFGCVYRYALDASFTPPSSVDLSVSLRTATARRYASVNGSSPLLGSGGDLQNNNDSAASPSPGTKPPSLVAVKLCRTPCSGSFDELQKTSLVDKKTRRAEMQDDRKMHVRIVRGEGRIFQYLQDAHQASNRRDDPPLVKLLANLSPSGTRKETNAFDIMDISTDEEEDGPPTRLLVFEKLIELDAERTSQGWTKSRRIWSHDRVEKTALEVMQGLQFLHEHNVTHGDLKPSNLMLDPRTGIVKIIDLGASRRFVHLSNRERNNRSAVEEQDQYVLARGRSISRLVPELCEGLGSLTGSPYYMAPEILLQATRYLDSTGRARSVLEDYEYDFPSFLAREQWPMYQIGLSDLRRGWGIRADIWSWACTVQALLLKTVEENERPSSSTISPYDFSFSRHRDEMIDPLYEKSPGEDEVPRFHQWCRVLPLLIVRIALEPVPLIPQADGCSAALRSALKAALRHQDLRPTADEIRDALEASRPSAARISRRPPTSTTPSSVRTSLDKGKRSSLGGVASSSSSSPQMGGSEFGHRSSYATPPLSQGASSVSTPQQTSETSSKSSFQTTPDRDRKSKVRFEASSDDSAFFPAPSPGSHLSTEADVGLADPIPQGFEMVSPARTPRIRSNDLGEAPRPATASASLQTTGPLSRIPRPTRADSSPMISRSHLSTPNPSDGELAKLRPATSPLVPEKAVTSPECAATVGALMVRTDAGPQTPLRPSRDANSLLSPTIAAGIGLNYPVESLRGLRLYGPVSDAHQMHMGSKSMPSSPMAHLRGGSVPMLPPDHYRESPTQMQSPSTFSTAGRVNDGDIGGSPRCSVTDGKGSRQSSLMATLKEKQVRLKQSSRKLMSKCGSGATSAMLNRDEPGSGFSQIYESPYGAKSEVFGGSGLHQLQYLGHDNPMPTADVASRGSPLQSPSVRGASSRRSGNKSVGDGSPSKPLLKRLLTWSTTS